MFEKVDYDDFNVFWDEPGLSAVLTEHPEVRGLWEKRGNLPGSVVINGMDPILHVIFEAIAESHIQKKNPPEAREAYERLQSEGFDPHTARAAIANLLIPHIHKVLEEKRPFESAAYARRLKILGMDLKKTGRNERCPCGSGKKFKKCCLDLADSIKIPRHAGVLILGAGFYCFRDYLLELPPDSPLIQIENRAHIAEFLEKEGDIKGAAAYLEENITQAEKVDREDLFKNALHDMEQLCLNHPELSTRGLEVTEKLIALTGGKEKITYCCDRVDMIGAAGRLKEAEEEYRSLLKDTGDDEFVRYRYALFLIENGRSREGESILRDLSVREGEIDDEVLMWVEEALESITNA